MSGSQSLGLSLPVGRGTGQTSAQMLVSFSGFLRCRRGRSGPYIRELFEESDMLFVPIVELGLSKPHQAPIQALLGILGLLPQDIKGPLVEKALPPVAVVSK